MTTAAELTKQYNELTGKSIKAGSYSKSKLIKMIEEEKAKAPVTDKPIPEDTETFTLAGLARELGIKPKAARAKYRRVENDGVRTRYIFPRTKKEIARVTKIIKGES